MAEEIKQEEKKCGGCGKGVATMFKIVLGLAFLVLGVVAIKAWWGDLLIVIKGFVGPFLILAGVITLAIAKE